MCELQMQVLMQAQGSWNLSMSCVGGGVCVCVCLNDGSQLCWLVLATCVCICLALVKKPSTTQLETAPRITCQFDSVSVCLICKAELTFFVFL